MKIIGITGPTGSGKSLLCQLFCDMGVPTVDADSVYHDMLLPPSECLDALRLAFGDGIFASDGSLDREKLGAIVFNSQEKLDLLNSTVLSRVIARIKEIIHEHEKNGHRAVAIDAPTLIESGFHKECSTVISVISPKDIRLERIIERDSLSPERAQLRIMAQKDDSFYVENSDFVLNNTGNCEQLKNDALKLFATLGLI